MQIVLIPDEDMAIAMAMIKFAASEGHFVCLPCVEVFELYK